MKALFGLTLLFTSFIALAFDDSLVPNPSLTPQQVVQFQLQALRENASGNGIEATYRFASPANRALTGPLERFSKLFDAEQYRPMLNHQDAEVKLMEGNDTSAEVMAALVDATGEYYWFRFTLSRQNQSPYNDCWMTDAVIRVPGPGRSA